MADQIEIDGQVVGDNTLYRVQVGNFKKAEEADDLLDSLEIDYTPRLVREVFTQSVGKLELFDQNLDQHFECSDGIRLVPQDKTGRVTLMGVRMNSGFDYEPTEDRVYCGTIQILRGSRRPHCRADGNSHRCLFERRRACGNARRFPDGSAQGAGRRRALIGHLDQGHQAFERSL